MTIRIDCITEGPETVIRISGRLSSTTVGTLKNTCDPIDSPLILDLSHLLFADGEGIKTLQRMVDKGTRIYGASPFIQLLLDNTPAPESNGKNPGPFLGTI